MHIRIDASGAFKLEREFQSMGKSHQAAHIKASNRTAVSARAKAASKVARDSNTLVRRVRRQSKIHRARRGKKDYARVWLGAYHRPIIKPSAQPPGDIMGQRPFRAKMPSGASGWWFRHPHKKSRRDPNRAAIRAVRVDLAPFIDKHLSRESRRAWNRIYARTYSHELNRRMNRVR